MPHKLLLADDSVTIQRVIELTFADEDVQVVAVSDGDQAIARLDADPPDIVLADIGMPGKDGYEVAAYVKKTPRLSRIPVVLLTGAFEPVDQARADEVGCAGVLAKPFEPQQVIGRVKELLERGANGNGSQPSPDKAAPSASPAADARSVPIREQSPPLTADLDGYFDRLDAAFATLGSGKAPAATPPDLPLSYASPAPRAVSAEPAAEPVSTPAPAQTTALPPLAEAFAAILDAEQRARDSAAAEWPATVTVGAAVTEDLIEQVTRRVLERLSDRVVREVTADIVAGVAERLVRDEIERLKSRIK